MKRRIIAALTALVMVVTMIPASAFAATQGAAEVNDIVEAIGLDDGTFDYKDKSYVLQAHDILKSISSDAEEMGKLGSYYKEKVEGAVNAITVFEDKVAEFKKDMAKLTAGSLESDGSTITPAEYGEAVDTYNAVKNGTVSSGMATINAISDTKELNSLLGEENVKVISKISVQNETNLKKAIKEINKLDSFALEDITKENLSKFQSAYNSAKTEFDKLSDTDYYAYLFAGYDKYTAMASVAESDNKVAEKANKIWPLIGDDVYYYSTGKSVDAINTLSKDSVEFEKFVTALADAKALIESTEDFESIVLVSSANKTGADFIKVYEATQENYDKFLTKDSVEATIKQLPSKVANANTYAEVVAAYNEWAAIDTEVAAIMEPAVYDLYTDAGTTLKAKLAAFNENTIVADYAAKVDAQIAAIPAIPTRADIAKIDAVIDTLVEYNAVVTAAGKGTLSTAVATDKLADKDVFELAKVNKKFNVGSLDSKLSKGALDKFNAAYAHIATLADADVDTITAVAAYVSDEHGDATVTVVNSDETKVAAEKKIADHKAAYNALNATQKADYDKAAADKTKVQFYNVKENIEAIEKLIAEYGSTDDKVLAAQIARDMKEFVQVFDRTEAKENTIYYNAQKAAINALDASMAKASVKAEVEKIATADKSVSPNVWKAYNDVKTYMDELVAESYAPTAVINAIAALKVLDVDTVTKAELDSTIVAYEAADKAYKALTPAEQAKVTNYAKLAEVKAAIVDSIEKIVADEINKIGPFDTTNQIPLTDAQKATVNGITVMKDQYKVYVPAEDFDDITGYSKYAGALANMEAEITSAAGKEFATVQPILQDVLAKYYVGSAYKVDKTSAVALINAIDKYNALSDEAKEYAKGENPTKTNYYATYQIDKLAVAADFAKTLVLDYATVEVADVEFDGTPATPAVVVKDFHGNAIDAKEFTVTYSNNDKVGTATVIVTAKADGKYVGTVTKEFKVIGKDLAKVENVKFDTDYGIVRVYFDRTADIDGVDVRYQVQYKKTTSDTWTTKYPTKGLDYLTLKNLTKNGKYDVRVRAYTDDYGTERVYGEYSDVQTVYANRNGAKSGIMYKAVIKSLTTKNSSVTMTVNPVKYTSEPTTVTWKFAYKKYGSQYTTWTTKSSKNTTYTFKNLKKGTRYVFRAQYTYTSAVDGKTAVNSNYSVYKNIVVK